MVNFIRNFIYGWNISKKYGYKFKPLLFKENKRDGYNFGYMQLETKIVAVNIFSKNFNEILFHEIGHVVDYKINPNITFKSNIYVRSQLGLTGFIYSELKWISSNKFVFETILREKNASYFACKALHKLKLEKSSSKRFLEKCFNTYLNGFNRAKMFEELARINYDFIKTLKVKQNLES